MIEINPVLHQLPEQQSEPPASAASPTESKDQTREAEDGRPSPVGSTSVYSVPVPPGYATPSNVPLITPAYTTPVIIRHLSMDDDGKVDHSAVENLPESFRFSVLRFDENSTVTHRIQSYPLCALSSVCFSKGLPQGNGD